MAIRACVRQRSSRPAGRVTGNGIATDLFSQRIYFRVTSKVAGIGARHFLTQIRVHVSFFDHFLTVIMTQIRLFTTQICHHVIILVCVPRDQITRSCFLGDARADELAAARSSPCSKVFCSRARRAHLCRHAPLESVPRLHSPSRRI
jgi:hypothetical protein